MQFFYEQYWSQCWYKNTFLVRKPNQISRAFDPKKDAPGFVKATGEWNNIHDSGCNFTCIAMILGIDPAHLATLVRMNKAFLTKDSDLPSRYLTGPRGCLVWEQNRPDESSPILKLKSAWLPLRRIRADLKLEFVNIDTTKSYQAGRRIVDTARKKEEHVIFGTTEHSQLITGFDGSDYVYWDPDTSKEYGTTEEDNLAGKLKLKEFFSKQKDAVVEFWKYRLEVKQLSAS